MAVLHYNSLKMVTIKTVNNQTNIKKILSWRPDVKASQNEIKYVLDIIRNII